MNDIKLAVRSLRRRPGFTVGAVLSLAIGIGACLAALGTINAVIWADLPFAAPDRLVQIWSTARPEGEQPADLVPSERFEQWAERPFSTLEGLSALGPTSLLMQQGDELARVTAAAVTPGYFQTLAVIPSLGRVLDRTDGSGGSPAAIVVSERFARGLSAEMKALLGRTLELNDVLYTVVGIVPSSTASGVDVWIPIETLGGRSPPYFVIARLAPGTSIPEARAELRSRVSAELADDSTRFGGLGATVVSYKEMNQRLGRQSISVLAGAAGILFIITLCNVIGLFIVRSLDEARSTAVRIALGAGRRELATSAITEAAIIVVSGTMIGALLAAWGVDIAWIKLGSGTPPPEYRLDGRLFLMAVALCTCATAALVLPAWRRYSNLALRVCLAAGQGIVTRRGEHRVRASLLTAQVAALTVLAVAFVVLTRSVINARSVALTPRADETALALIDGSRLDEEGLSRFRAIGDDVTARLDAMAGLDASAAWLDIHVKWAQSPREWWALDRSVDDMPTVAQLYHAAYITPDYFKIRGMRIDEGRGFLESDNAGADPVIVISKRAADAWWPAQSPVGQRIKLGPAWSDDPWRTVVGVVDEQAHLNEEQRAWARMMLVPGRLVTVYLPWRQLPATVPHGWTLQCLGCEGVVVAARSAGGAAPFSALNAAIHDAAPNSQPALISLDRYQTDAAVREELARNQWLIGGLGTVAAFLAILGIYSLTAENVRAGRREIAVRVALGAPAARLIVGQMSLGAMIAALGIVAGAVTLVLFREAVSRVFFMGGGPWALIGTSSSDPRALVAAGLVVCITVVIASFLAARRATAVDPLDALRE